MNRFLTLFLLFGVSVIAFAQKPKSDKTSYLTIGANLDVVRIYTINTESTSQEGQPRTSKHLGMKINDEVDEKLDVKKLKFYYANCPDALARLADYELAKGFAKKYEAIYAAEEAYNKQCHKPAVEKDRKKTGKKAPELEEDEIKILGTDPENLKGFQATIGGFLDYSEVYNLNAGAEIGLNYKLPKTDFLLGLQYGILHSTEKGKNNAYESYANSEFYGHAAQKQSHQQVQIVLAQQIFGKVKARITTVDLGKKKLGASKLANKADVSGMYDSKVLKSVHLRAGLVYFNRPFKTEGLLIDSMPVAFNGYETKIGQSYASATGAAGVFGVSFRTTVNDRVKLNFEGKIMEKANRKVTEFFVDILPALQFNTSDVNLGFGSPDASHGTYSTGINKNNKFGFRGGFRTMSNSKFNVSFEAGQWIGIEQTKAYYIKMGAAFNLVQLK
jgi:hypothetical protein